MTDKLDLVLVHINHKRQTLTRWLAVSFNDLILLSGFDIRPDKLYEISYTMQGVKFETVVDSSNGHVTLWPEHGMEFTVTELNR